MMGKTHTACGAMFSAGALVLLHVTDPAQAIVGMAFGSIGSLVPDIDHPQATLARRNMLLGAISRACAGLSTHRRFWHTPVACAAITIGTWFLLQFLNGVLGLPIRNGLQWCGEHSHLKILQEAADASTGGLILTACVFLFIGMISHLFADSLNPEGVPWLWPLRPLEKKLHVPVISIKTNTGLESLYSGLFTLLALLFVYFYLTRTMGLVPDFLPDLLKGGYSLA